MTFQELPQETQEQLRIEQLDLVKRNRNTAYEVHIYDALGSRYFYARRICQAWSDTKGNCMPFGGGSHWRLCYGRVQFESYKTPVGTREYRLCDGRVYGKSANGTVIPKSVSTKKEVMAIAKAIGIFNI